MRFQQEDVLSSREKKVKALAKERNENVSDEYIHKDK